MGRRCKLKGWKIQVTWRSARPMAEGIILFKQGKEESCRWWSLSTLGKTLSQYGMRLLMMKQPQFKSGVYFNGYIMDHLPIPSRETLGWVLNHHLPTPPWDIKFKGYKMMSRCQAIWVPKSVLFSKPWKIYLSVPCQSSLDDTSLVL